MCFIEQSYSSEENSHIESSKHFSQGPWGTDEGKGGILSPVLRGAAKISIVTGRKNGSAGADLIALAQSSPATTEPVRTLGAGVSPCPA